MSLNTKALRASSGIVSSLSVPLWDDDIVSPVGVITVLELSSSTLARVWISLKAMTWCGEQPLSLTPKEPKSFLLSLYRFKIGGVLEIIVSSSDKLKLTDFFPPVSHFPFFRTPFLGHLWVFSEGGSSPASRHSSVVWLHQL